MAVGAILVKEETGHLNEPVSEFLQLVILNEQLVIGAVDGKRTLTEGNVLLDCCCFKFVMPPRREPAVATEAIEVGVYDIIKDGTPPQIIGSLVSDLNSLCFSEDQIVDFIEKHRDKMLSEGAGTFFLFQRDDSLYVAIAYNNEAKRLFVRLHKFDDETLDLRSTSSHRLITPQATSIH